MGQPVDRRVALRLLVTGLGLGVAACSRRLDPAVTPAAAAAVVPTTEPPPSTTTTTTTTTPTTPGLPPIPPPRPGPAKVIAQGDKSWNQLALTIDDGFSPETVAAYVKFAERTKIPITFSPNGHYGKPWEQHRDALAPLIERQQVQIGNHTWSHTDLVHLDEKAVATELERNEEWIEKTFGITARPWFRPPFGSHDGVVRGVAGRLGFTKVVMWNGTFSDASDEGSEQLMGFARQYLHAGVIMLGHANQPAVTHVFDKIEELIAARALVPVTLDTMFGTSRAEG